VLFLKAPRKANQHSSADSRYVAKQVKHEVCKLDGGKCCYVAQDGKTARSFLRDYICSAIIRTRLLPVALPMWLILGFYVRLIILENAFESTTVSDLPEIIDFF